LDNAAIARVLEEIADLLEIKGENPFKIRAYRNAADIAANHPHELSILDVNALREIPGIGKDLAARIREIAETGSSEYHRGLASEFPPSILDMMRLQGVGPKTVATLYRELGVQTLDHLERAATDGRLRTIRGMGIKKEALILKAIDERKQHAGRNLLATAHDIAASLVVHLQSHAPSAQIAPVGSLRRGCESVGDIDLLVSSADASIMNTFVEYEQVERVLVRGETKSSVRLQGGVQADMRLVPADGRGAAEQYFTGSKNHNIALRDRAIGLGYKLNEYGLFRTADDVRVAGASEGEIYEALGLAWIPPELREARGEIEAAAAHVLPQLVERRDLRGDLHMHTTETDGHDDIAAMARAARDAGHEYIAITDHSQSLAMANGMNETRALAHAARIRALDGQYGVRLLAGVECDIRLDGTMDLADDCLAALDFVVASIHSGFNQERQQITDRILRAIENPYVDVIGHPTGRKLLARAPYPVDLEIVAQAAARTSVALEINSHVNRLDLSDVHARMARDRGVHLIISTDSHATAELQRIRWGVVTARRGWITPADVLNTRPFDVLVASLRRNRPRNPR
jgi:DNA polymerase (family X)